jgi:hypothetical protein
VFFTVHCKQVPRAGAAVRADLSDLRSDLLRPRPGQNGGSDDGLASRRKTKTVSTTSKTSTTQKIPTQDRAGGSGGRGTGATARSGIMGCRSTPVGAGPRYLTADDQGRVCRPDGLEDPSTRPARAGCCAPKKSQLPLLSTGGSGDNDRFVCDACSAGSGLGSGPGSRASSAELPTCCAEFAVCVACCQRPAHRAARRTARVTPTAVRLGHASAPAAAAPRGLAHPADAFAACLEACRTSSRSVVDQNKYRHPDRRFCWA